MFLRSENSDHWVEQIKSKSADNSKNIIAGVKADALRPHCLKENGAKRREYFNGAYLPHFEEFLAKLYPAAQSTKDGGRKEIHPYTVNYFKTWAIANADIYRNGEPTRTASTEAGTKRLAALAKQAKLATALPNIEEKMHAAQEMFLRILRNPKTDKIHIKKIWPDRVYPIVDDAAPEHLEFCHAVGIQMSASVFELWVSGEDEKGLYWTATQYDEKGDKPPKEILKERYRGRLPICAMYMNEPDGSPFLEEEQDKIALADNTMLSWTEIFHTVRMQGHTPVYIASNRDNINPQGGPGGITRIGEEDTMGTVPVNPKIDEHRLLLETWSGAAARAQGQSPRAFMNNPQPLNSGVALRVDNQIAEEKRPQRVTLMNQFEEDDLLPILDEVERLLAPRKKKNKIADAVIDFNEITVTFPRAPNVEDNSQKQLRLEHAADKGWISPERAAVEARYYDDEEAAKEAMKDLEPISTTAAEGFGGVGERGPEAGIKKNEETT